MSCLIYESYIYTCIYIYPQTRATLKPACKIPHYPNYPSAYESFYGEYTRTHAHTHTNTHTHKHTNMHKNTHTHSHTLTHTHSLTLKRSHTLSHSTIHTHTFTHSHTRTQWHADCIRSLLTCGWSLVLF